MKTSLKTIHLISHTHWDREWYRTFQQFRMRLVHLVDGLLDLLAKDREFRHFMLDGQTIVLDDYLQVRPESEETLTHLVRSGRVLIGPWHILPDMFLVSPEAHIRNLLAGDRVASRFGPKMRIGYMPDSFGHIGQMPQILQGFGIDNACLWRGLDDQPPEFWWQAPDGTRVLMLYLRDSYGNGANLNTASPAQFAEQIRQAGDSLAAHSIASDLLVMFGTDHMEPPPDTSQAVRSANKLLKDYRVVHSTLPAYYAAIQPVIQRRKSELPVVTGELRSSKRIHLLPGVLSTRIWIKQRNHECENLLEKWAEPFSTFASHVVHDTPPNLLREPASFLRQAWMLLLQNHPHDSICGCSNDQVHEEMRPRFDQVSQIGEEITRQGLDMLAGAMDTHSTGFKAQSAIVVFNPRSSTRTDVVSAELALAPGMSSFEIVDGSGTVIPHQSASGRTSDLINIRVERGELGGMLAMINEGRVANLAVQDISFNRSGATLRVEAVFAENAEPNMAAWSRSVKAFEEYQADATIETFHIHAHTPDSAEVLFAAPAVPPLGWKTLYIRSRENTPSDIKVSPLMKWLAPLAKTSAAQKLLARLSDRKERPPYIIANEYFSVKLNMDDATLSITDKKSGMVYHGLNRFVDSGDCGDEYNFSPPLTDRKVEFSSIKGVTVTRGDVQQVMTISLLMEIPEALTADRKSRSSRMVEMPITTRVILTNGVPRVDLHTRLKNQARDHRLRVHFPAPFKVDSADYDGHFEVVRRPLGVPPYDETWSEEPRPETHQRTFTSISSSQASLTIASRGLPEVEVLKGSTATGSQVAITLLRCVGWLSRDDFTTRKSHAGPFLETPLAQMPGEWEFDYSILPGVEAAAAWQEAWNYDAPLRAAVTGIHKGSLPAEGSFIQVDNPGFVISSVKESESGDGWILRGYNILAEEIPVTFQPWRKFKKVSRANMGEKAISPIKVGRRGEVTARVRGHEVATFLFQD
jgi:alpha-mannosidase